MNTPNEKLYKPCPRCTHPVLKEANFCPNCGLDLRLPTQPARKPRSVMATAASSAAIIAVVLSLGTAVYALINATSGVELIGDLICGMPVNFMFWWLVCVPLVWTWRKLFPYPSR